MFQPKLRRASQRWSARIQRKEELLGGFLGNAAGIVRVPGRQYYVYVRLWNGEVVEAYNGEVQANPGLPVKVAYRSGRYAIAGARDVFDNPLPPQLADGITDQMTWPGMYTVNIRGEQYLPGLVSPLSGFTVRFYGDQDFAAGVVYIVPPQDIDLTAHIPASGARWILLELVAGAVQVVEGALAGSVDLLTSALIPAPSGRPLAAVRLYAGQVAITRGKYYSDILDLRTASAAANGDATYLRLDGANSPLTGNVDFGGYKAIAMTCDSGATLPSAPSAGQWFRHTPAGRNVLMQFTGSTWQPIVNFGATTVYVDPTGTDSQDKGFGTGTDAYATYAFAYTQLATILCGYVNIYVAAGTYTSTMTVVPRSFIGNFAVNIIGTLTAIDSGTVTSGVAGSGATRASLTDTTKSWTVNAFKGKQVTVNGVTRVCHSNTATTLTLIGVLSSTPSGAYTINDYGTVSSRSASFNLAIISNTVAHNFSNFRFVNTAAGGFLFGGSVWQMTFTNCHLDVGVSSGLINSSGTQWNGTFTDCYATVTGSGTIINALGLCSVTQVRCYLRQTGAVAGFGALFNTNGVYNVNSGNTFEGFFTAIYMRQALLVFNNSAAIGYTFIANNTAGIALDTGGVVSGQTNNQYSGNTTDLRSNWSIGELLIQAFRNVTSLIIRQLSGQTTNALEIQDATSLVHNKLAYPGSASATENVFNEQGNPYLDQRMESDTETHMVWLDASADVLYLGGQTNGIKIYKGGRIELIGTATVFDDLPTPLIGQRLESPSSHIVINAAEAALEFKTSCDLTDYVIAVPQITHRWKLGSVLGLHLHWEQTSATMPNWLLQYRWQKQGQAKTTAWTSLKWVSNAFTYASGTLNQITGFGTITPPVGYNLSDILDIRILRDVANGSGLFSGADALAVSVLAKSFDPHVEIDSLGSDTEYAK